MKFARPSLLALLFFAFARTAQAQTAPSNPPAPPQTAPFRVPTPASETPPPFVSPEVDSNRRVTFRFFAPNDKEVTILIEGVPQPLSMQKNEQGLWSATTAPLTADYYGYSIVADGVLMADPLNATTRPSFTRRVSEVHVPGAPSSPWEFTDVPRGELHHHFYQSRISGGETDYIVYTPPGYSARENQMVPVLYLLHGYGDDATAWTTIGRVHVILDNLIAQRVTKPMIVVMPLGYGTLDVLLASSQGQHRAALAQRNFDAFGQMLLEEIRPRVEREYAVLQGREAHAVAGLSMGGAEALLVGLQHAAEFAWVGAFSSGGLQEDFDTEFHLSDGASGASGPTSKPRTLPSHLWIACGTDDGLIALNRKLRTWLTSKNIPHTDVEMPGGHTWMVWRRAFVAFVSSLFR